MTKNSRRLNISHKGREAVERSVKRPIVPVARRLVARPIALGGPGRGLASVGADPVRGPCDARGTVVIHLELGLRTPRWRRGIMHVGMPMCEWTRGRGADWTGACGGCGDGGRVGGGGGLGGS